ncbi:MAG: D-tyrosyl-tRNA(Tyr) deacylase [Caldilineae bacterium]|nr:D-tyrosyl-tRNA(Tyr) deacylase [Chloroflexota bacterium]MCB9176415.1 D-tyrosyl-tRNA(Tyr) deacylase [Caldilineae bacterium]
MRALIQRVARASVRVDGETIGAIGPGLLVLLGVGRGDTEAEAEWLARKLLGLRVFGGEDGRFDRSVEEVEGALLVVSQFTLYGDARRGRRPDFTASAAPERAEALYEHFVACLGRGGRPVETGRFGAMMAVELVNDGPVTLLLEREARGR